MGLPSPSRVYVDASVILAMMTGQYGQYCERFKKQVLAKEVTGVVTNLVVYEIVNKVKLDRAKEKSQTPAQSEVEGVRDDVMEIVRLYGFELQDIGKGFANYESEVPLFERAGSFIVRSPAHRTPQGKWKVLGIPDATHIALAENAGVDFLLAADSDYDYVQSNVKHKQLWEVYK